VIDPEKLILPPVVTPPVPVRLAVCGLFEALSVTVKVPVNAPLAEGANKAQIVQCDPAASDDPQAFDTSNGPLTLAVLIDTAVLPVLVRVNACQLL
jgi:hypothetical protein